MNSAFCFSQNFEIINQNEDYQSDKKVKEFYFIHQDLDESAGIKVADMKFYARNKGNNLSLIPVFYSLWEKANALGANAFFINEIEYDAEEEKYNITVELSFLNEEEIDENISFYPQNLIGIIGNVNTSKKEKGKSFKLNKEKLTIYPFEYITYQNNIGEKVNISVGGIMGASTTIKGEENKLPLFFSIGGASINPFVHTSGGGGGGIAFSNGSISALDMNLGLFLMEILKDE